MIVNRKLVAKLESEPITKSSPKHCAARNARWRSRRTLKAYLERSVRSWDANGAVDGMDPEEFARSQDESFDVQATVWVTSEKELLEVVAASPTPAGFLCTAALAGVATTGYTFAILCMGQYVYVVYSHRHELGFGAKCGRALPTDPPWSPVALGQLAAPLHGGDHVLFVSTNFPKHWRSSL